MTTNQEHDTDGRGNGAMDRLKTAWREATGGPREDELPGQRGPGHDATPEQNAQVPGMARNDDIHPDESARQASGMSPAGRQTAVQAQPTPGQAPGVSTMPDNRPTPLQSTAQQSVPHQSAPQQTAPQQTAPQQTAPQPNAPQPMGSQQTTPQQPMPQQSAQHGGTPAQGQQLAAPAPAPPRQSVQQQPTPTAEQPRQTGPARMTSSDPSSELSAPSSAQHQNSQDQRAAGHSEVVDERGADERETRRDDAGGTGPGPVPTDRASATDEDAGRHQLAEERGSAESHDSHGAGTAAAAAGVSGAAAAATSGSGEHAAARSDTRSGSSSISTTPAGSDADSERLIPGDRASSYASQWDSVKGEFVDEPREAVRKADTLVGEVLDELQRAFKQQRSTLEHGLDTDETSTEDLRLALHRYRKFFDRLLKL